MTTKPEHPGVPIGAVLADRYEVRRTLGAGGMATVYAATDRRYARDVAVKVLGDVARSAITPERFHREIAILSQLQHPNILPLYDSGSYENTLYYVMPLIDGENLRQRLEREPRHSTRESLGMLRQVALALDHCHGRGIVHRDIKPENILLTGGATVVADFGIAHPDVEEPTRLTAAGAFVGTPHYTSPEQTTGELVGPASDQYALACVAYEVLVGAPPFDGATTQALLLQHWKEPVPSASARKVTLPPSIDAVLTRALAKQPNQRFASCTAFIDALEACWSDRTASDGLPQLTTGRRTASAETVTLPAPWYRRPRVLMAGGVLTLLLGALAVPAVRQALVGTRTSPAAREALLVVLPLTHRGDSTDRYLAEGLTEEIRGRLSSARDIRTLAATSSNQYSLDDVERIREELRPRWVVGGSVTTERDSAGALRMRLQAQLLDVSTRPEQVVWSKSYVEQLREGATFDMEARVANGVAQAVSLGLAPAAERGTQSMTRDPEAYALYLRALPLTQSLFDRRSVELAITLLDESTRRDSLFGQAWAKLTYVRAFHYYFYSRSPAELTQVSSDLRHTVSAGTPQPDRSIAEAFVAIFTGSNMERARQLLEAALANDPSNKQLRTALGALMRRQGDYAGSITQFERVKALDPRSPEVAIDLAVSYLMTRQYAKADAELMRCLAIAPSTAACHAQRYYLPWLKSGDTTAMAHRVTEAVGQLGLDNFLVTELSRRGDGYEPFLLIASLRNALEVTRLGATEVDTVPLLVTRAEVRALTGRVADGRADAMAALPVVERRLRIAPELPELHTFRARILTVLGDRAGAIAAGQRARQLAPASRDALRGPGYERPLLFAYLAFGDTTAALDLLERQLSEPADISAASVRVDPRYALLRGHPRFEALLRTAK